MDTATYTNDPQYKWLYEHGIKETYPGINWTWIHNIPEQTAKDFIDWLNNNGGEHRGMYPENENSELYAIRFR